jgi:hypothetical protein
VCESLSTAFTINTIISQFHRNGTTKRSSRISKESYKVSSQCLLISAETNNDRYRGFIEVKVGEGEKQKTFDVHESLIASRSLFFKKAMSGSWKESKDRIVNLPEEDPEIFKIYVHHLYTGSVAVIPEPLPAITGRHAKWIICRLYVLAEKIQDVKAKNSAIEALLAECREKQLNGKNKYPGSSSVSTIYSGTLPGSMARKVLVDLYSCKTTSKWITKSPQWSDEFLRDLLVKIMDKRAGDGDLTGIDVNDYLEPEENKTGA